MVQKLKSQKTLISALPVAFLTLMAVTGCSKSSSNDGGAGSSGGGSTGAAGSSDVLTGVAGTSGTTIGGAAGSGAAGESGGLTTPVGDGGAPIACGDPGFQCCANNNCKNGGCCVQGMCVSVGATCLNAGGGTCSKGACGSCGGPGQPCCPNGTSASAPAQVCTAEYTACGPSGSLGNICSQCGAEGMACCAGSKCASGCCSANTCIAEGKACPNGTTCRAGVCAGQCGELGQTCCPGASLAARCGADGVCSSVTGEGICAKCGAIGDFCCADNRCGSDACCSSGRCVALVDGGVCTSTSPSGDGGASAAIANSPCAAGASIPLFTGTQTVDGNDTEFNDIPAFELTFANAGRVATYNDKTAPASPPEKARAKVAWDSVGFHAFIQVTDPNVTSAKSVDEPWNGDGIELMFSSSAAVTGATATDTATTMHVIVSGQVAAIARANGTNGGHTALPAGQAISKTTATGYAIEMQVPWPTGATPASGTAVMFDLELNSAKGAKTDADGYTRDKQAILFQGPASAAPNSPCGSDLYPYCDDRLWCPTKLQ